MSLGTLLNGHLILADGAMGTYYQERFKKRNPETQNIRHPERIVAIHREYLAAGARLLRTNSFASNLETLLGREQEELPREQQLSVISENVRAAYGNALLAVEQEGLSPWGQELSNAEISPKTAVYLAGDIGPIPERGREEEELLEEYQAMVDALMDAGARLLWFETFADLSYIRRAAAYAKARGEVFIQASFCLNKFGYTRGGISAASLLAEVKECNVVDGIGFNCGVGPAHMYQLLQPLDFGDLAVSVFPNSGYSDILQDRAGYQENSAYFLESMKKIVSLGINIAGGCCGTRPEYIARMARELPKAAAVRGGSSLARAGEGCLNKGGNPLYRKLLAGEKPVVVELDPPHDGNCEKILKGAVLLQEAGVDLVTFSDSPMGKMRADSIMTGARIQRDLMMPVMPHVTCRDKNRIAMGGAFFGAHMNGIRNLLLITGDPVPAGDRSGVTGVFDFNSMKLMEYLRRMNLEYFPNDPIVYGGALNQGRANLDKEIARVQKKLEAGADYFLTQPVFSREDAMRIAAVKEQTGAKILCGIMPLVSYRNASFMKNEVFGICVPEEVVERYHPQMSRSQGEETGIALALEMMEVLSDIADGYYFMVPFNRVEMICRIIKRMNETCRI
ncbi:MAG: bifunctional homocysteine S-methyltransferase/methylenetetrahydrofolate reductase [Lachnospiraceae bacterium]|nr:bifunctional homocysteine S-methyltransferase/methylenetetrahydrofolate reductase [Lachnospiraceae bacterium]